MNDFYEDDEPIEQVRMAFGAEPHLISAPPVSRWRSPDGLCELTGSLNPFTPPTFGGVPMVRVA